MQTKWSSQLSSVSGRKPTNNQTGTNIVQKKQNANSWHSSFVLAIFMLETEKSDFE